MRKFMLSLALGAFVFIGCERAVFEGSQASGEHVANFEYLWKEFNEKYAFFEEKGVNWQSVHRRYLPRVIQARSDAAFFSVLADMLDELRDGHVNLVSPFNTSQYSVSKDSRTTFDFDVVNKTYLQYKYNSAGPFIFAGLSYVDASGRELGSVGYVRFRSFTGTVTEGRMKYLFDYFANTRGMIFDIRENSGGTSSDVIDLLRGFIDKSTTIYYVRNKDGKGADDFTPWEAVNINPYENTRYLKPVMVLVDRGVYSAGSYFALGTKAIDHVFLVGDNTGGGLGIPNGGQMPNGWFYRFSVTQTTDKDGNRYETSGVPPDIKIVPEALNEERDEVIDTAVREIFSR